MPLLGRQRPLIESVAQQNAVDQQLAQSRDAAHSVPPFWPCSVPLGVLLLLLSADGARHLSLAGVPPVLGWKALWWAGGQVRGLPINAADALIQPLQLPEGFIVL